MGVVRLQPRKTLVVLLLALSSMLGVACSDVSDATGMQSAQGEDYSLTAPARLNAADADDADWRATLGEDPALAVVQVSRASHLASLNLAVADARFEYDAMAKGYEGGTSEEPYEVPGAGEAVLLKTAFPLVDERLVQVRQLIAQAESGGLPIRLLVTSVDGELTAQDIEAILRSFRVGEAAT